MLTHIPPSRRRFTCKTRPIFNGYGYPGSESGASQGLPGAQSSFARARRSLARRGVSHPVRGHYPSFTAHTGSCARPNPSRRLRSSLGRRVFAGCRQSLLGGGPSRRYLRESFSACLNPYPGASPGAHTRFFPGNIGLHRLKTGSAKHHIHTATSVRGRLRGCSYSIIFRPADLLATQVAPTAVFPLGSRGFYVRAYCGLLPPRTSDMLAVRIGQLTAWGLSPH